MRWDCFVLLSLGERRKKMTGSKRENCLFVILMWIMVGLFTNSHAQGTLAPPGTPAPTMKTLDQLEPRIPIKEAPFEIKEPGSYYFTKNLTNASITSPGITVNADNVTIDMCGFTLTGLGLRNQSGIYQSDSYHSLRILNGKIMAFQGTGDIAGIIAVGKSNRIENIQTFSNQIGIASGDSSVIIGCTAVDNLDLGIYAGSGSVVTQCASRNNADDGIKVGEGSTISGCAVRSNQGNGYDLDKGGVIFNSTASFNNYNGIMTKECCTITNCSTTYNDLSGISVNRNCNISGCISDYNETNGITTGNYSSVTDCESSYNKLDGINMKNGTKVMHNIFCQNGSVNVGGAGIHVDQGSYCRIQGNQVVENFRGIYIEGAYNITIQNTLAVNTIGISIDANNHTGTLSSLPSGSGVGTTDPWANFILYSP